MKKILLFLMLISTVSLLLLLTSCSNSINIEEESDCMSFKNEMIYSTYTHDFILRTNDILYNYLDTTTTFEVFYIQAFNETAPDKYTSLISKIDSILSKNTNLSNIYALNSSTLDQYFSEVEVELTAFDIIVFNELKEKIATVEDDYLAVDKEVYLQYLTDDVVPQETVLNLIYLQNHVCELYDFGYDVITEELIITTIDNYSEEHQQLILDALEFRASLED